MIGTGQSLVLALLFLTALLLGSADLAAQETITPASLRWVGAPPLLPPGAMIAVVSGNPAGPGQSTIQLSMPDGYRMPPHFHPTDERVEVQQGTLLVGMGDRLDAGRTVALAVGDTIVAPAGVYCRAEPGDMSVLDGQDDRRRAELISGRLKLWKSITST